MEKAVNSLSGPTAQLVKEAVRRQEEQMQLQQQLQQVAQDSTTSSSPVLNQQPTQQSGINSNSLYKSTALMINLINYRFSSRRQIYHE